MAKTTRTASNTWRILRDEGVRPLAQRAVRMGYRRLGAAELEFSLLDGDIADSTRLALPEPERRPTAGTPLQIGWVTTPPAPGSGGHTTMFRMIRALEDAGHECVLFLYDRYGGETLHHAEVIRRSWPWVRADVRSIDDGLHGMDACLATSWQTAHVLARRSERIPTRRLYFAQDFEPYFYPRGSEYALAEDTYRFGFTTVTIGHMVARLVTAISGRRCEIAEFGCDTDVYGLTNEAPRTGIAFYAKPGATRRGFTLAALALEEVHRRHPNNDIHLFGDSRANLAFPAVRHGNMSPAQLASLYNTCATGLAMSFTNISLIAEELLACGTIPIVNDGPDPRADLDNPHVRWAAPTPGSLADALSEVLELADRVSPSDIAASVRRGWSPAQRTVVRAVEHEVYGA